jgi:hypothetical protein
MTRKYLLFAVLWLVSAVGAAEASHEPFAVYENWNARFIRGDRWTNTVDTAQDAQALVRGSRAHLRLRREGSAAPNAGFPGLFSNRLLLTNPSAVDQIEGVFTVRQVVVDGCPANPLPSIARAALLDMFKFSDLDPSVPRVPGASTGDVQARVMAFRASDSPDSPGALAVGAFLLRCNNASCTDATTLQSPTLGHVTVGQRFRLRLVWDAPANQFRARLDDGPDVSLSYAAALNQRDANAPAVMVRVQHRPANCTADAGGPIEMDVATVVGTIRTNASAVIP